MGEIFENIIVNIFYWIRCMTGEFTSGFRDSLKVSKNYYHNCIFNLLHPSLSSQKLVKPCWTCKTSFRVLISVKLSWEREREREKGNEGTRSTFPNNYHFVLTSCNYIYKLEFCHVFAKWKCFPIKYWIRAICNFLHFLKEKSICIFKEKYY